MGNGNGPMLSLQMLKKMLHTRGAEGQRQSHDFLDFVEGVCPWFPEEGTVSLAVAPCILLFWVCTRIHV